MRKILEEIELGKKSSLCDAQAQPCNGGFFRPPFSESDPKGLVISDRQVSVRAQ